MVGKYNTKDYSLVLYRVTEDLGRPSLRNSVLKKEYYLHLDKRGQISLPASSRVNCIFTHMRTVFNDK